MQARILMSTSIITDKWMANGKNCPYNSMHKKKALQNSQTSALLLDTELIYSLKKFRNISIMFGTKCLMILSVVQR